MAEYLLTRSVLVFLSAISLMIFIRIIFPLFASEEGVAYSVVYATTEPLLSQIRAFLFRFEFFAEMPVDLSGIVAFALLFFLSFGLKLITVT